MGFKNLRDLLTTLEEAGRLKHVTAPVEKDWEIACIARWVCECAGEKEVYALQFDNVKGYQTPVVVGLYASRELYGRALNTEPHQLLDSWSQALRTPFKPRRVASAPVQTNVTAGDDVDLATIPIPVWTPGRDAGPYVPSGSVITRDPETGIQNMGVYRLQVHNRRQLGLFFGTDRQHGAMHYARYCDRNEPMPIAIVIGGPPVVNLAAAAKTAYGVDELDVAGGLAGNGVDVVSGHTVDLLVPAQAEYVIEGFVAPEKRLQEGPFGEALGHMNEAAPAPVIEVSAICHRDEPIFHGYVQQLPPSEGHLIWEMGALGPLWFYLTEKMGLDALCDLAIVRGSAGLAILAAQLRLGQANHAQQIAKVLSQIHFGQKIVLLVDEDVDIRDLETLQWALSTRVDPARDVHTVENVHTYQPDPAVLAGLTLNGRKPQNSPPYTTSMMIVDATLKCDTPEISLPGNRYMDRAWQRWPEYGLPALSPRKRLQQLLRHHSEAGVYFNLPE